MVAFGDIVKVELPPPVGCPGHEQFGFRPAIIVQDDVKFRALPTTIVVPLTTNYTASRLPGTFFVKKSSTNGLTQDSIALVFQVRAIDKKRVKEPSIGKFSGTELDELR